MLVYKGIAHSISGTIKRQLEKERAAKSILQHQQIHIWKWVELGGGNHSKVLVLGFHMTKVYFPQWRCQTWRPLNLISIFLEDNFLNIQAI